jgi:hypothetical protein
MNDLFPCNFSWLHVSCKHEGNENINYRFDIMNESLLFLKTLTN